VPDDLPDIRTFGALFSQFVESMSFAARALESEVAARMREHLGADPRKLPATAAEFAPTDHANLQLALEAVLPDAALLGMSAVHPAFTGLGLSGILSGQAAVGPVDIGPVQYTDVEVGDGRTVRCVATGLFLASRGGVPVVLLLSSAERPFGVDRLRLEGISPGEGVVSALLADLRAAMREHNVYRRQVISLHSRGREQTTVCVQFHRVPEIARDAVVLPEGTIERLERHAIGIADRAEQLRAAGRQLKRGVLLHGPPGTGKTLTVNYLLGAMPGRTTVLLNGRGLSLIEPAVAIARELTPATVVLEDVDLVAAERTMPIGTSGILYELLNQIEGLAEDADLLFLLTTNRADLIEPALATRPGRVDLALEIPLPDEDAREKLVRLYAHDVPLDEADEHEIVERTAGLTGAFIKELMRQAGLRAALEDRPPVSGDATAALAELLEERSTLTRRLLGQGADGEDAPQPGQPPFPAMLHAFGAAGIPLPDFGDE
jgi:ATPase family associated with various cellular activities (AAA)